MACWQTMGRRPCPATGEGFLGIMLSFSRDSLFSNSVLQDFTAFHALQAVVHTFQLEL